MMVSVCRDNSVRGFTILTAFTAVLASFIELVYKGFIPEYFLLFLTSEYSYLAVAFFIILGILVIESRNICGVDRVYLGRILVASTLIMLSLTVFLFSYIANEYIIGFKTISIILLIWGVSTVLLGPRDLRFIGLPLFLLVLLIPIPRSILDEIALILSEYIAVIASAITGAGIVRSGVGGQAFLRVVDSSGKYRLFEVAGVCSGIASLLSVLSLVVIPLYLLTKTRSIGVRKKVLGVLASLSAGLLVVFVGNILRVALVVWATKYWSYTAALNIFHATPAVIYSSIAAIVVVYTSMRLFGVGGSRTRVVAGVDRRLVGLSERRGFGVVLLILLIISVVSIGLYTGSMHSIHVRSENTVLDFKELYSNVSTIIFNGTGVKVLEEVNRPALIRSLGSSLVKEVVVKYNGSTYTGYIEVAETPSRFHSWSVCLSYQGYSIEDSWSIYLNNTVAVFMRLRTLTGEKMTLAYSVYEIPVYIGGRKFTAYIRLSLFKHGVSGEDLIRIFSRIKAGVVQASEVYQDLSLWLNMSSILFFASTTYLFLVVAIHLKSRFKKRG